MPAETAPLSVAAALCLRDALSTLPARPATEPVAWTLASLPTNINPAGAVAPAGVHLHVLPVRFAVVVFAVLAPVSVSVAVAGAQLSVPRSPVRVLAAAQFVAT